jgi:hypothetical protein
MKDAPIGAVITIEGIIAIGIFFGAKQAVGWTMAAVIAICFALVITLFMFYYRMCRPHQGSGSSDSGRTGDN